MFKPKLLRLIIYLVVSIALIILLVNTPTEEAPKKEKKEKNVKEDDSFQMIELPDEEKPLDPKDEFFITLDSANIYIHEKDTLNLDELLSEIRVQKEKRPKLILLITVHPRSKSELLMNVVEFAKREKIKIGITKN